MRHVHREATEHMGANWLGRNEETASLLCSLGGNGMRRAHREATELVLFIGS